ncbi:TIGR02206 family membrane protein [Arthrobacter castelli]|uniref:YwaF family protein n=1 Tax=Arthrobacter castelli TaxID=271431 RepID=UPI000410E57F|nr:TIGR02206 family membrane protein [Arthrobacter castelli]
MQTTAETFDAYGLLHWTMLAVTVIGAVLLVRFGRRRRATPKPAVVARAMAILLLSVTLGFQVYWLMPQNFDLQQSLPLHLSDILRLVAAYALWTRRRWAVGITYYWGLTLNPQAMLTPDLSAQRLPVLEMTSYWSLHILVMWAVIYLTWGMGRYPRWSEYRFALLFTGVWAAVVFGINSAIGTNYGYLNAKPGGASLLDLMGEWPLYLLVALVLITVVWALITWPWSLIHRKVPSASRRISGAL